MRTTATHYRDDTHSNALVRWKFDPFQFWSPLSLRHCVRGIECVWLPLQSFSMCPDIQHQIHRSQGPPSDSNRLWLSSVLRMEYKASGSLRYRSNHSLIHLSVGEQRHPVQVHQNQYKIKYSKLTELLSVMFSSLLIAVPFSTFPDCARILSFGNEASRCNDTSTYSRMHSIAWNCCILFRNEASFSFTPLEITLLSHLRI